LQGGLGEPRALLDAALELSLATHSTRSVTLCLAGFARLALAEGDPKLAAPLAGAADGLRRRVALRGWPLQRQREAEMVSQIRQALGPDRFDQTLGAGPGPTLRQAVAAIRKRDGAGALPP